MKKQKNKMTLKKGFTLIELLIVIAIIGILAGVVFVSSGSGVSKAKRASVLTTMASVMPELVTCQDDAGLAKSTAPVTGNPICCTTTACTAAFAGHSETWKDINTKNGYTYGTPSGTLAAGNYQFTATNGTDTITCSFATGTCI